MKKIILGLAVLGMFISFGPAIHADGCGDVSLNHPEFQVVNAITFATTTVPAVHNVNCSGTSPELIVNVWGTMNSQLPHIKPGQTKMLLNGTMGSCPFWFPFDCVDITGTAYYQARWGNK